MKTYKYILFALLILSTTNIQAQTIVYVDGAASGADNGTSWVNAYKNLQTAIDAAALSAPAQVWVKAGTYKPTSGTDRTISFIMKNDVEIYGGFIGTESLLNQRNWKVNQTILSGEIGNSAILTDNSHCVINNVYTSGSPLLRTAILDGFTVTGGYLTLSSLSGGAGMRNSNASPIIRNVNFLSNNATIPGNYATSGGAILNIGESHPYIESCIFDNNYALSAGGAISFGSYWTSISSNPMHNVESVVVNCLFKGNLTKSYGSAIYINNYYVNIYNNTLTENEDIQNNTFVYGRPIYYIFDKAVSNPTLANNIIWNNLPNGVWYQYQGGGTVLIQTTNLQADPFFVDALAGNYTLSPCTSPARNSGTNIPSLPSIDLNGQQRVVDTNVDIGAYEYPEVAISISTLQSVNVDCFGEAQGQISVNATGKSPLTYSIDGTNFSSNSSISGLIAGTYDFVIKDGDGCLNISNVVITQPTEIILATSSQQVTCNGGLDGKITVNATGGSGTYEYKLNSGNYQSSNVFDALSAGNYTVSVKDISSTNCIVTSGTITISQPSFITATTTVTDAQCFGSTDGGFTVSATGGTAPLYYTIEGLSSNYLTSPVFTGLAAGNYTLTVIDSKLCYQEYPVTINQPTALVVSTTQSDILCNGAMTGAINATVTGGTAPYEYSLDGTNFQASTNFSGLDGGSYDVTVKDAHNCTATQNITIAEPDALVLTTSVNDISCNGLVDGSIGVSASGGTTTYVYSMDGVNFSAVTSFDNLAAGDYTITLKDGNGCETNEQVSIVEPAALSATIDKTDVTCNGADDGVISFTTSGGTGTVEASIDGTNFQTGDFTGLASGNYTVTFKDANGCTLTNMETISEPIALTATLTVTDLTCPAGVVSGRISIAAVGGTAPYEYSMDGTNFQTASIFSLAEGGNYEITIRDANACVIIENATVNQPDAFVFSTVLTDISCNGENDGSISVTASGGTSPYEYSIDGTNFSTNGDFTGLMAGGYTIQLMDANGCSYTEDFTINEPDELTVSASFNGTSVDLSVTGGTSPYTYSTEGSNFQSEASFTLPNGNYTFTVQDDNGCVATTTEQLLVTGVELGENINSIEMYPNPALNSIMLSNTGEIKSVEIRSTSGKLVYKSELNGSSSSIDISDFKGGSYLLLLIKTNGEMLHKRFIKN